MIDKGFFGDEYKGFKAKFIDKFETREHVSSLIDTDYLDMIAKIFNGHIWQIWINNTEQPLFTSDSPIVLYGHGEDLGIASLGIEIAYPLTPQYIVTLCERSAFKHLEKFDGRTRELKKEHITFYNRLQVVQSNRQIYCSAEKFDLAIEICSKHPELCDPNRPQLIVR